MDQFGFLLLLAAVAASVGFLMAGGLFVILSLAPQKKFRQLPVILLFMLLEVNWVSLWFLTLFFIGSGMTSNVALYSAFGVLLVGMSVPVTWVVYARIGIARQKIRPVILSLQKLELNQ